MAETPGKNATPISEAIQQTYDNANKPPDYPVVGYDTLYVATILRNRKQAFIDEPEGILLDKVDPREENQEDYSTITTIAVGDAVVEKTIHYVARTFTLPGLIGVRGLGRAMASFLHGKTIEDTAESDFLESDILKERRKKVADRAALLRISIEHAEVPLWLIGGTHPAINKQYAARLVSAEVMPTDNGGYIVPIITGTDHKPGTLPHGLVLNRIPVFATANRERSDTEQPSARSNVTILPRAFQHSDH